MAEKDSNSPDMEGSKVPDSTSPAQNAVDISPKQDGGVLKEILREGVGTQMPGTGDKVSVHYVGKLQDGTLFDSSRDRGDLFEFDLGKGSVIKGWDIGVATMKKGELALLTCTSEYAYGEQGSPPKIPANATLVFEVELFSWTMEDLSSKKDQSILRRIIQIGEGYSSPKDGALIEVHLKGSCNGTMFEERDVNFTIGEGSEFQVPIGIEEALQQFKKGETSLIKLKPHQAFGAEGSETFKVPPNADVEYEVTLKSFEKAKDTWELSNEERLEQSELAKSKGSTYFKAGKFELALKQYKRASSMVEMEFSEEELKERRRALLLASHLNLAMCYLKLEDHTQAITTCDSALELDPNSEKGFFRRGQAYMAFKDYDKAKHDFEAVLVLDKENKAAKNQLIRCQAAIKQYQDKEKRTYMNMFSKFAEQDERRNARNGNTIESGVWENGQPTVPKTESEKKIDELEGVPIQMLDGSA